MSIEAMKQAYAVPLIEQLESVPTDARMMYEHDKFHHQNIPVGRLCHEAATALRQAITEAEKQEPVAQCSYPKCQATNGCVGACSKGQAEKQEPSLWFAIGKDGRVKYTTDSDRALKWKQAGSYRLVRDYYTSPVHASDISQKRVDETAKDRHDLTCVCGAVWVGEEMVCSPRKREWVGLTDNEARKFYEKYTNREELIYAIDEFLEEKNGG